MKLITIDFETYYDKQYSLSRMTTEEYINDPLFEVIGVAIKHGGKDAVWYPGAEAGCAIKDIDWSDKAVLAHNTIFDGAILSWKWGVKPKLWLDTLSMAKANKLSYICGSSLKALAEHFSLGEKGTEVIAAQGRTLDIFSAGQLEDYGEYCRNDVELTHKLFGKLKQDPWFTATQLILIDLIIRMYTEPTIVIDKEMVSEILKAEEDNVQDKLGFLQRMGYNPETAIKMLRSDLQFADMLKYKGVTPPVKRNLSGVRKYAFAKTDEEFLALLKHEDATVRKLASARLAVKTTILPTRARSLLGIGERNARLPIHLNYMGAHTSRLSGGGGVNLQNLPHEGGLRNALMAPPGHKLVVGDSSQIEARMLAYIADQRDLVTAFAEGRDVYCEFASEIYGKTITKEDTDERFVGKTGVLGLGYGCGAENLQKRLSLGDKGPSITTSDDEAHRIVRIYRGSNHKIVSLWGRCDSMLRAMLAGESGHLRDPLLPYDAAGLLLPGGFLLSYPDIASGTNGYRYRNKTGTMVNIYGSKVVENLIQSLAAMVIAEHMAIVGQRYKVALAVHDEIVVVCRSEEVSSVEELMATTMSTPPEWAPNLPLACEIGVGDRYGEAK